MKAGRSGERGGIVTRLIVLLFFALFCAVLYLARHPLMRFWAESWIVEDPLQISDAILLLGDDNFYADRATRAAELFRQGLAPVVVASGRRLRPNAGISELMEHDLIERGVPKDRIVRFAHDADSTTEEAQALEGFVAARKWKSVIVVTSNYHTRRARYIFRRVFPGAIRVSVASAHDGDFDPSHWYEKSKSIKRFIWEMEGMAGAMWELRHQSDRQGIAQVIVFPERRPLPFVV